LPTQNLVPRFIFTLIKALHVNIDHATHHHNQTRPSALRWPLLFKTKDGLALLVMIIDERQIFKYKVYMLRPG
jgi:hypothetical protein